MSTDRQDRLRNGKVWIRLVLMLVYAFVVFELVALLLLVCMLFQFVYRLVKGEDAERLRDFTADLNAFIHSALQYVTFNSDQRPFPFCDWPAASSPDDYASRY